MMREKALRWSEIVKVAPAEALPTPRGTDEVLQHLMLAVLSDAVNCYQEHFFSRDHKARRLFEEAASWLDASDREYVFSFESICEVLGLDPTYLRGGLRTWREQELSAADAPHSLRRRRRTRTSERRRRIVASL